MVTLPGTALGATEQSMLGPHHTSCVGSTKLTRQHHPVFHVQAWRRVLEKLGLPQPCPQPLPSEQRPSILDWCDYRGGSERTAKQTMTSNTSNHTTKVSSRRRFVSGKRDASACMRSITAMTKLWDTSSCWRVGRDTTCFRPLHGNQRR